MSPCTPTRCSSRLKPTRSRFTMHLVMARYILSKVGICVSLDFPDRMDFEKSSSGKRWTLRPTCPRTRPSAATWLQQAESAKTATGCTSLSIRKSTVHFTVKVKCWRVCEQLILSVKANCCRKTDLTPRNAWYFAMFFCATTALTNHRLESYSVRLNLVKRVKEKVLGSANLPVKGKSKELQSGKNQILLRKNWAYLLLHFLSPHRKKRLKISKALLQSLRQAALKMKKKKTLTCRMYVKTICSILKIFLNHHCNHSLL